MTGEAYFDLTASPTLEHRLDTAQLAPAVENQLWHYAFGKPPRDAGSRHTMHLRDPRTLSTSELEDTILQQAAAIRAQRDATKRASPGG
jgi:hypothetical protein